MSIVKLERNRRIANFKQVLKVNFKILSEEANDPSFIGKSPFSREFVAKLSAVALGIT